MFYELGVRQSFNKRTVLICDKNTVKPFDTSGIRTLDYSSSLRIDEVKKSIPEIAKCIKDTYEADAKEVNSLLQLLSIEPAVLPIYSDDNFGTPLGTLEGDNRTHIMIRNDKKELVAIPRKSEKGFRLATLPF